MDEEARPDSGHGHKRIFLGKLRLAHGRFTGFQGILRQGVLSYALQEVRVQGYFVLRKKWKLEIFL